MKDFVVFIFYISIKFKYRHKFFLFLKKIVNKFFWCFCFSVFFCCFLLLFFSRKNLANRLFGVFGESGWQKKTAKNIFAIVKSGPPDLFSVGCCHRLSKSNWSLIRREEWDVSGVAAQCSAYRKWIEIAMTLVSNVEPKMLATSMESFPRKVFLWLFPRSFYYLQQSPSRAG